jgi:hypothetical protein
MPFFQPGYQSGQQRNPDDTLVVVFKTLATENEARSKIEGRPIYEDIEIVEIRAPGSRDIKVFPATEFCGWRPDLERGGQLPVTYAERFPYQYRQFKEHATQTKAGTPLDRVPFLTEARRAELRALNVYTVEQLAAIEGQELKNLGPGGREHKNRASEYITETKLSVPSLQMQAELEALRARNQVLEDDVNILKEKTKLGLSGDAQLDAMTDAQLKDYIGAQTGARPVGSPKRETLLRSAMEAKPKTTQAA